MSSTTGGTAPTRRKPAAPVATASTARWAFLAPEDTVICREPAELMRRLAEGFASGDQMAAFVAANRLALEAFRSRERDLAAEVCRLEIDYASEQLCSGGDWQTAMLGLQPVINLIRLKGYTGELGAARDGLAALEAIADGDAASFGGLALDGDQAPRVRALARNNCLVETAKIFWRRGELDEMTAGCARLAAKWPHAAQRGPYHAAEAGWLATGTVAELPASGALRRIAGLHVLTRLADGAGRAGGPGEAAALADELFGGRREALAKPPAAAARDLAILGESLAVLGRGADAADCLAQAHASASQVDPGLANQIRGRWLAAGQDGGESPAEIPAELSADRLGAGDLRAARDLAVLSFGLPGARQAR